LQYNLDSPSVVLQIFHTTFTSSTLTIFLTSILSTYTNTTNKMYRENRPGRLSLPAMWSPPEDAMPKHHHHHREDRPTTMDRSRQASTCSERSCEGMTADETRDLWRCMLELQLRYGCYNSTRIDMALDAGDEGLDLMREFFSSIECCDSMLTVIANRFIIDILNESVIDLPDEGREMLNRFLSPSSCATKQKWKFWKKE
jgi:hypothetical protein